MGWRPLGHFNRRDSQAPNIGPSIVMRLPDHLRSDPKRTSHNRLSFINGIRQLRTHSKIGQLDMPIIRQQHIPTLDIPMTNLLLVQIFQPQHDPRTTRPNTLLGHGKAPPSPGRLDQIANAPPIAEFHDDPHFPRLHSFFGGADEAFEVADDVGGVAFAEDVDFAHDFVGFFVAVLVGDHFDGDDGSGGLVAGAEDLAEGAFAEHLLDFELRGAILLHGCCQLHGHGELIICWQGWIMMCRTKPNR
mmetsp:Transcript_42232/g.76199  ORF Transcript_42232/g.76199 Transcript_42232/m.76199 type:complete len:246 (-) Transcript_42232:274-1011(-)